MRVFKMVLLAGIGTLTSASTFAVPLDITWIGGTPSFLSISPQLNPGFQDFIPIENLGQVAEINPAGVNSINMTWNAPSGYMYVVNPVPRGFDFSGLSFEAIYGNSGQASSLGSITASSLSVHTIYGTSPLSGGASLNFGVLNFVASAGSGTAFGPFAFNSITISADFSGMGTSQRLGIEFPDPVGFPFGVLYGGFAIGSGPDIFRTGVELDSLLTLEPLPTGTTPDNSSTLGLAGFGFVGLLLFGGKRFVSQ
ncbi:MAG TPA: hypothetical protein VGJ73_02820 [Verrucomicrobiae bacterium]